MKNQEQSDQVAGAIRESIQKYEKILHQIITNFQTNRRIFEDIEIGVENCSLCKLFYNNQCKDCPIQMKTKITLCGNTPYTNISEKIRELQRKNKKESIEEFNELTQHVVREITFLALIEKEYEGKQKTSVVCNKAYPEQHATNFFMKQLSSTSVAVCAECCTPVGKTESALITFTLCDEQIIPTIVHGVNPDLGIALCPPHKSMQLHFCPAPTTGGQK